VVQNGRVDKGMPKFALSTGDISDIADFIHSFPTRGGLGGPIVSPANPVVGDANAGQAYFNGAGKCNTCHSVTGDLTGIGAKYDPRTLQGAILSGTAGGGRGGGGGGRGGATGPARTVTVTLPSGQKIDGKLGRIDFFVVTLTDSNGNYRSFRRDGDVPKVDIHDPLQAHKDKLATFSDSDIHNLTAYLVTLK
jgi:cytochrome c oxidase cbb3-type subunit 3